MATDRTTAADETAAPALELTGISKRFPGVQALDRADLTIRAGEVHGLVGENGAGKSTIIKVLAGVYDRDEGSVVIGGDPIESLTAQAAHDHGVRFIHQELHLVPHFTVTESVFMGHELTGPLGLRRAAMRRRAERVLADDLGAPIDGGTLIRDLGPAERKLVQIARALVDEGARLVVFDEPTAPLAAAEIDRVFAAIERLRDSGIAILYVSHYLGEITAICDRVTVFRNGCDVGVIDDVDEGCDRELIRLMVGRDIGQLFPAREAQRDSGAPALRVAGLGDGANFRDVDVEVARGEIVGVAGLLGSGREELIDGLVGLRRTKTGTIEIGGAAARIHSPADALARGMVLVPRDRRQDGLVLDMDVSHNINLATLDEVATGGWIVTDRADARAAQLVERMDVRPTDPTLITRLLSGGNQQKVVLGRWLAAQADVFLLDEPTVGVDIGAKAEIYRLIADLAARGAGVLVSSNDPTELLGTCDRIVVMMRGEVVADRTSDGLELDDLIALTTGGRSVTTGGAA